MTSLALSSILNVQILEFFFFLITIKSKVFYWPKLKININFQII